MATTLNKILIACLVAILATPLSGEVFAQSEEIDESDVEEIIEIEDTDIPVEEKLDSSWYRSERISGNIEVGDFVVGPGRTELELAPGETAIMEISVTNRITDDRRFKLEIEDVVGSADGSRAVVSVGDATGPYSVKEFISFPNDQFDLALGERARIPVTISIPEGTEPGGHYGSVLVSTVRRSASDNPTAPQAPIVARIGSLFFITVSGDVTVEGETKDVSLVNKKLWHERGPVDIGILFENSGSVHLNPYGEVSITNMFDEEVGFVELEPWFVLPKSLRTREITWDREFLLGRYKVTAKINRGYEDIVDEFEFTFWVLPWKIVGSVFLVLFIIFFSIRAFFRKFEFKRKDS